MQPPDVPWEERQLRVGTIVGADGRGFQAPHWVTPPDTPVNNL